MATDEKIDAAIKTALKIFNIEKLKSEQEQILRCLLDRTDCLAVLPTGFGKTLPFHMFIPVCRELGLDVGKILVCCPLISLMQDQVTKLGTIPQLTAAYKGKYYENCLLDFFW
jgi:ATP-dependent DNA helicase RecQ